MVNKPLTADEIKHFDEQLGYDLDTVVCCTKCGRTQYLRLEWGVQDGWSECCGAGVMPIIYHKASDKDEEDLLRGIRVEYLRKVDYTPKGSQVF